MTVTCEWFLAAARIIAGPPMSMFSTPSAYCGAASAVTVARKGYRLTTTTSMVPMECSSSAAMWPGASLRARMPPCTAGCSVFTRPSSISG